MKSKLKRTRELFGALKHEYPALRVRLRFVEDTDNGGCEYVDNSRTLVIRRTQPKDSMMDSLLHEFAHAVAGPDGAHGSAWGLAYAKCYRIAERSGFIG